MFSIVVDGTADIPPSIKDQVYVVPLYVVFQGKSYRATEELLREGIENMLIPGEISTSMPTAADFLDVFNRVPKPILVLHVSKNISGTYRAIHAAKEESPYKDQIFVFDTLTTATGIGSYALVASHLRSLNKRPEDVMKILKDIQENHKERTYAVVGDVRFTINGGRVKGLAGMAAKAMRIMITVSPDETGTLRVVSKSFGRKKALRTLRTHLVKILENAKKPIVGISHAWCYDDALFIKDYLHALFPEVESFITPINPTLIAHGGKGTLAASVLDGNPYI